jgi:hypothetical protein
MLQSESRGRAGGCSLLSLHLVQKGWLGAVGLMGWALPVKTPNGGQGGARCWGPPGELMRSSSEQGGEQ